LFPLNFIYKVLTYLQTGDPWIWPRPKSLAPTGILVSIAVAISAAAAGAAETGEEVEMGVDVGEDVEDVGDVGDVGDDLVNNVTMLPIWK
jgi:hypothetical protein